MCKKILCINYVKLQKIHCYAYFERKYIIEKSLKFLVYLVPINTWFI